VSLHWWWKSAFPKTTPEQRTWGPDDRETRFAKATASSQAGDTIGGIGKDREVNPKSLKKGAIIET